MSETNSRKPKNDTLSRRQFITATTVAAGLTIVPRHIVGASRGSAAPSDRLNVAAIGVGGRGVDDLEGVKSENIVALCDVDDVTAAPSYKRYPKPNWPPRWGTRGWPLKVTA